MSASEKPYANQIFMMRFGFIVGPVFISAGLFGLYANTGSTLAILEIVFGLFILAIGIQKALERRRQINFETSNNIDEGTSSSFNPSNHPDERT